MMAPKAIKKERTSEEEKEQTLSRIREVLSNALYQQLQQFNADKMLETIINDVKEQRDKLVLEMLGVSNKWGRWELVDGKGVIRTDVLERFKKQLTPVIEEEVQRAFKGVMKDQKHPIRLAIRKNILESMTGYNVRNACDTVGRDLSSKVIEEEAEKLRILMMGDPKEILWNQKLAE